ncbi:hypothetical protein PLESTB_000458000 [Pleodorina starrii]|uniref:DNA repair and recombination protein RAD54B n=1 Tax=Pleodorina starrii TaxID=330485 RepID=A0A9W6BF15_9CHLO|nr:hypothetical protein PLESTB_000458000 [Pleodorina starrii]
MGATRFVVQKLLHGSVGNQLPPPTQISALHGSAAAPRAPAEAMHPLDAVSGSTPVLVCPVLSGLQDSKLVSKGRFKTFGSLANADQVFEIGNWHAEVDKQLTPEDFKSGACFMSGACATIAPAAAAPLGTSSGLRKPAAAPFKAHAPAAEGPGRKPRSAAGAGAGAAAAAAVAPGLHDPTAAGAVVLNSTQWDGGRGRMRDGRPVAPVVIDPYLGRHLRPHQEEGVRFMYDAVMGLSTPDKTGCILADEMGLGKTLQVITLTWTLLRQGPEGRPLAGKVLVVTPATLVDNWGREVKKWLGSERLQVTLCLQQSSAAKQQILEFRHGCHQRMMITSYETLRKHAGELRGAFDLLVCDEGHRLKSVGGNKTIDALLSLDCPRRIVLTGTPVQNDLKEFYALLSFVVPDVLGSPAVFNRVYGIPITRSQEATATTEEKELGAARASELQSKVSVFILRRTQALLAKHLPPLTSLTLFCKPSDQQIGLYGAVLRSKAVASLLYGGGGGGGEDNTLAIITALRKVANHPDLMLEPNGDGGDNGADAPDTGRATSSSCLPSFNHQFSATGSHEAAGKMRVLSVLLSGITARGERCVVVSTSTATLDLVGSLVCGAQGLTTVRIDGGTSVDGRQTVVDNFNKLGMGQVFLLSTRAGGAGLNLVGANHLVLYDSDWNPAMDQQAMARIWRDGQTKPCFVYRLLTTGTIEEKVYQRQLMKADLASATVAGGSGAGSGRGAGGGKFTREELRQLFSLNTSTASDTRDLLPQGNVAGLRWIEPQEVPQDGSPLAAVAACGLVTCLNQMETTAMSGSAGGDKKAASPAGSDARDHGAPAGHAAPREDEDEDDGGGGGGRAEGDGAEEPPEADDEEGEDVDMGGTGGQEGDAVPAAATRQVHQEDGVDCLDVLEDW